MASIADFFSRQQIPQQPNPEPPGYNLLRDMLMRRAFSLNANPYGMSPQGQGNANMMGPRRQFDPYGGRGGGMGGGQTQQHWGNFNPGYQGGMGGGGMQNRRRRMPMPPGGGPRQVPFRGEGGPSMGAPGGGQNLQMLLQALMGQKQGGMGGPSPGGLQKPGMGGTNDYVGGTGVFGGGGGGGMRGATAIGRIGPNNPYQPGEMGYYTDNGPGMGGSGGPMPGYFGGGGVTPNPGSLQRPGGGGASGIPQWRVGPFGPSGQGASVTPWTSGLQKPGGGSMSTMPRTPIGQERFTQPASPSAQYDGTKYDATPYPGWTQPAGVQMNQDATHQYGVQGGFSGTNPNDAAHPHTANPLGFWNDATGQAGSRGQIGAGHTGVTFGPSGYVGSVDFQGPTMGGGGNGLFPQSGGGGSSSALPGLLGSLGGKSSSVPNNTAPPTGAGGLPWYLLDPIGNPMPNPAGGPAQPSLKPTKPPAGPPQTTPPKGGGRTGKPGV